MQFLWTTITVQDMDESLGFYEQIVGLSLQRRVKTNKTTELAFLGTGPTMIELIHRSQQEPQSMSKNISIGFAVDDLDAAMQHIKEEGLEIFEGPFSPNPQIRFFYVLDPNGLKIQFVERR